MPHYMTRTALSAEALRGFIENPADREEALKPLFEAAGFKLDHYFFAPGSGEVITIIKGPDDVSSLDALFIAIGAGGATVPGTARFERIIKSPEFTDATRAAAQISYTPPSD
jgi:uncharacterized protein with GYD domain